MYITGIDPTVTTAPTPNGIAPFALGDLGMTKDSTGVKIWMFVKDSGSGVTGAGYAVNIDNAYSAVMTTTANTAGGTGQGKQVGFPAVAVTANYYYWAQVYGPCSVRVAASAVAYTQLNTTATAGQIDDDATAASRVIDSVQITTTNGGAAATAAGFCNWPRVGRTL